MTAGSREQLLERIKSFDYWHYPFDLGDGIVIESKYAKSALERRDFLWPTVLERFRGSLEGMHVLDIGCNAGFWSLEAHRLGAARVLGIDPRGQCTSRKRSWSGIGCKSVQHRWSISR